MTLARNQVKIDYQKPLGVGTHAAVFEAVLKNSGQRVAVKKASLVRRSNKPSAIQQVKQACEKEVAIMKLLSETDSRAFMSVIDAYEDQFNNFYIVMPLIINGTLTEFVENTEKLNLSLQVRMALQLMQGLRHMHEKRVLHLDGKSDNVLINENYEPIITDFGFSVRVGIDEMRMGNGVIPGTPMYWSPELISAAQNGVYTTDYDEAVDVFAFTMIVWQIFAKAKYVYLDITDFYQLIDRVLYRQEREIIPNENNCPKQIAELITWGWSQGAKKRPSAAQFEKGVQDYLENNKIL